MAEVSFFYLKKKKKKLLLSFDSLSNGKCGQVHPALNFLYPSGFIISSCFVYLLPFVLPYFDYLSL